MRDAARAGPSPARRALAACAGFAAWAAVGSGAALALAAAPSFGIFLAPLVAALAVAVARRAPGWPNALGLGAGVGLLLLAIGLANLDYRSCERFEPVRLAPGESYSCGGWPPAPWLVAGAALLAGTIVARLVAARRPPRRRPT